MSKHQIFDHSDVRPVDSPAPPPTLGEAAAPDLPVTLGRAILLSYAVIMLVAIIGFAHGTDATMMVAISVIYTAIYLAVPTIFLKIEDGSHVEFHTFLRRGLQTWTGHLEGFEAALQILMIPIAIAVTMSIVAIIAAVTL